MSQKSLDKEHKNLLPKHLFFTDGLPHQDALKRYKKRRQKLAKDVKGIIIIEGRQNDPGEDFPWHFNFAPLMQDPFFLYLTGINQKKSLLIIDNQSPNKITETLFLPKDNPTHSFWEGPTLSPQKTKIENKKKFGMAHVLEEEKKDIFFNKTLKKNTPIYILNKTKTPLLKKIKKIIKTKKLNCKIKEISSSQYKSRLELDKIDLENNIKAQTKTYHAFINTLPTLKKAQYEHEIQAELDSQIKKQSWLGNSFTSIIANEENATILHYTTNNQKLKKNSLLLLDFGLRYHSICTDISRTIPLNGSFNPLQALLYSIVLETQTYVESLIKPGETIESINKKCWDSLNQQVKEKFLKKGGKWQRLYKKSPHFVSHLIAHQVHDGDPDRKYKKDPLKPNMIISNEPGIYGLFELEIKGEIYKEHIGIRIEDNILVTPTGCKNLSSKIPKEIKDIERILATID